MRSFKIDIYCFIHRGHLRPQAQLRLHVVPEIISLIVPEK